MAPEPAGEPVDAIEASTDQLEAAFVAADGSDEPHLRVADGGAATELRIDAPGYTVVGSLSELTSEVVTGP
jgi:hypothetical protein